MIVKVLQLCTKYIAVYLFSFFGASSFCKSLPSFGLMCEVEADDHLRSYCVSIPIERGCLRKTEQAQFSMAKNREKIPGQC